MANAMRGEASFTHDDAEHILVFDAAALMRIEDELDLSIFALFEAMAAASRSAATMKVGTLATILQAGLARQHPEIDREGAAELLMSGNPDVQAALGTALTRMMPQPGDPGSRPPVPAPPPTRMVRENGIGPKSSRAGSKRAGRSKPSGKPPRA